MKALSFAKSPYTSLTFNAIYALGNCIIGFLVHSWWFITIGAYYCVLTATRYSVLQIKRKANGNFNTELFARRVTGILLVVLSICIVGVNILSVKREGNITVSPAADFRMEKGDIMLVLGDTEALEAVQEEKE